MWLFSTALFIFPLISLAKLDCSQKEYERCIKIADPLVKEAHLVFPDNLDDIDLVCRTWNRFVDCLKYYTDNCFTDQQRKQFNRAVEMPIESIHQMCMQPSYQKEYLQYAPCIKSTIIENVHCRPHYNLLVDHVSQGDIISKSTLCCTQDRFKQCVKRETRRLCDRNVPDGPASRFSEQIIDKALSFLQDQCLNYIPNSGDCTAVNTDPILFSDPMTISTSPSEVYPWSTVQEPAAKEIYPSRPPPPTVVSVSTTDSWTPSTSRLPNDIIPSSADPSTTDFLGRRTRPASYGRSSSWSESSPPSQSPSLPSNTVQMYPESPSTPTSRPDWATLTSWNGMEQNPSSPPSTVGAVQNDARFFRYTTSPKPISEAPVSETWYPAAGNQLNNEVDEPNQLGLKKPRNKGYKLFSNSRILSAVFVVVCLLMY